MAYFISICSGKGGTGKSTTAINLGYAMKTFDKDVTLLDNNLTTPNLGVYLGLEDVSVTLNDSLRGKNHATEAMYIHNSGLKVIPSSIALKDLNVNPENLRETFLDLKDNADIVIVDNSGGLSSDTIHGIRNCNEVLVVTNPDIASVTGALRVIKFAENLKKPIRGVVLSRVNNDKNELSLEEIEKTLGKEVIAIVEEDNIIKNSLLNGNSVIENFPKSKHSIEYKKLAARILGVKFDEELEEKKSRFFNFLRFLGVKK